MCRPVWVCAYLYEMRGSFARRFMMWIPSSFTASHRFFGSVVVYDCCKGRGSASASCWCESCVGVCRCECVCVHECVARPTCQGECQGVSGCNADQHFEDGHAIERPRRDEFHQTQIALTQCNTISMTKKKQNNELPKQTNKSIPSEVEKDAHTHTHTHIHTHQVTHPSTRNDADLLAEVAGGTVRRCFGRYFSTSAAYCATDCAAS